MYGMLLGAASPSPSLAWAPFVLSAKLAKVRPVSMVRRTQPARMALQSCNDCQAGCGNTWLGCRPPPRLEAEALRPPNNKGSLTTHNFAVRPPRGGTSQHAGHGKLNLFMCSARRRVTRAQAATGQNTPEFSRDVVGCRRFRWKSRLATPPPRTGLVAV